MRITFGGDDKEFDKRVEEIGTLHAMQEIDWERKNTCKICKKIVKGDLYPYKRGIFGGVKNYICKQCKKKLKID